MLTQIITEDLPLPPEFKIYMLPIESVDPLVVNVRPLKIKSLFLKGYDGWYLACDECDEFVDEGI